MFVVNITFTVSPISVFNIKKTQMGLQCNDIKYVPFNHNQLCATMQQLQDVIAVTVMLTVMLIEILCRILICCHPKMAALSPPQEVTYPWQPSCQRQG